MPQSLLPFGQPPLTQLHVVRKWLKMVLKPGPGSGNENPRTNTRASRIKIFLQRQQHPGQKRHILSYIFCHGNDRWESLYLSRTRAAHTHAHTHRGKGNQVVLPRNAQIATTEQHCLLFPERARACVCVCVGCDCTINHATPGAPPPGREEAVHLHTRIKVCVMPGWRVAVGNKALMRSFHPQKSRFAGLPFDVITCFCKAGIG